jgi:hypothetical protein
MQPRTLLLLLLGTAAAAATSAGARPVPLIGDLVSNAAAAVVAGAAGGVALKLVEKAMSGSKEKAAAPADVATPAAAAEGARQCAPMEPDSLYYYRGSVRQTFLGEGEFEVLEEGLGAAGSKACPQKLVPQQTYRLKGLRFTVSAVPDEETGLYAVEVRRTAPKVKALEE